MSPFKYPFVRYLLRNAMRLGKLHEVERILQDKYLDESIDFVYRDETPLYLACATGNRGLVDLALAHTDTGFRADIFTSVELREKCLHLAAELGFEQVAETLLKWGADVSAKTESGITPLHLAALGGHEGIVRMLIKNGANVKDKDSHGFTALHMTCFEGHCELVRVLIDAGANVNEPSKEGIAPLHIAAERGHAWMARELIESGAEMDVLTCSHYTSLDCAVMNGQIEAATVLVESGASLDYNQTGSGTPLHHAIHKQDCAMVELLLAYGADVDHSALVIACDSNNDPDDRIVYLLLAHGVDVTSEDSGGLTALHYAISNSRKAVVGLLLERGANVNHHSQLGHTPLEFACRRAVYSPLTVMTLLEYGADFTSEDEILRCCNAYFDTDGDDDDDDDDDFEQRWSIEREPLDIFELFFTKLQTAGLCSPDEIFVYPPGLSPTLDPAHKAQYRQICAMEVSSMKKNTIGTSGVSYYDFLIRTDSICRNDEVTDSLPEDFRAYFPHYGQILNARARKALKRWRLINRSYSAFPRLMKYDFPTIVTDHVFSYFSDQDLENLIEVGNTIRRKPSSCSNVVDNFPAVDLVLSTKFTALENNSQQRQTRTLDCEETGDDKTIKKLRLQPT